MPPIGIVLPSSSPLPTTSDNDEPASISGTATGSEEASAPSHGPSIFWVTH